MDVFAQMASKIIKDQQAIIGPVAFEQARKVPGLKVDDQKHEVMLEGNEKEILGNLVEKYKGLFGQASVEVCKDAVRNMLSQVPPDSIPALLR